MDHCIIYFSSWVERYPEEELASILEESRFNNSQRGITGVTLYVRGNIIQVLEGPKDSLETLYGRIKADQRHINVNTVLNRPITHRLFTQYLMGFQTITHAQLEEIKAIVSLEKQDESVITPIKDPILRTINVFYRSNLYN